MNQSYIELARAIAWPSVAAFAIILLVPGGYLLKIIDKLSDNASAIAKAITTLRTVGEKLSSDIDGFQKTYDSLSNELSPAMDMLKGSMENVIAYLRNVEKTTSEILVNIGKDEISKIRHGDAKHARVNNGAEEEASATVGMTADQMYETMMKRWDDLYFLVKEKIGPSFDGRTVGRMAARLARRRLVPLAAPDAELIASLHSQYKRFARLQGTRDDWLSFEIFDTFVKGVDQAMLSLSDLPSA